MMPLVRLSPPDVPICRANFACCRINLGEWVISRHDAAIRIAVQPGASFAVHRLCEMPRYLVASPAYLRKHGGPKHPLHLVQHRCISYDYTMASEVWRFTKGSRSANVRPRVRFA
jgi:DNA-binding transcriptional LysR family regulator